MTGKSNVIHTSISEEIPSKENPFIAEHFFLHGYDVYGDLLGKISWPEYIYLLFKGEAPTSSQKYILENLAISLANPGPRDHSVRAAMNGGAGASTNAACLMSALAVGAGCLGGSREIFYAVELWQKCGVNMDQWRDSCFKVEVEPSEVWPKMEHIPGFYPYLDSASLPTRQTLDVLCNTEENTALQWLRTNIGALEEQAGYSLSIVGVAATALYSIGMDAEEAELLYLILRLPGAAVHSLEQRRRGWKTYPFWSDGVKYIGGHNEE